MRSLPEDHTPAYRLPVSFHKTSTVNAWQWMDVYGEKGNPKVKKLRLLRAVIYVRSSRHVFSDLFLGQSVSPPAYCGFSWPRD